MDRRAIMAIGLVLGLLASGVGYHRWSAPESAALRVSGPLRPHGQGHLVEPKATPAPAATVAPAGLPATSAPLATPSPVPTREAPPPAPTVRPAALPAEPDGRVDISTAGQAELERLPGIGPARARDILATRAQRGGFQRVEDLLEVPGIGEKRLEALRPFVAISGGAAPVAAPAPNPEPAARIDINRATAQELEALDGVGPKLAAAIVADRAAKGPFRSPEDLARVKGVGPSILRKNRERILAGPSTQ